MTLGDVANSEITPCNWAIPVRTTDNGSSAELEPPSLNGCSTGGIVKVDDCCTRGGGFAEAIGTAGVSSKFKVLETTGSGALAESKHGSDT